MELSQFLVLCFSNAQNSENVRYFSYFLKLKTIELIHNSFGEKLASNLISLWSFFILFVISCVFMFNSLFEHK